MKLWEKLKQSYTLLTSDLSIQDIMTGMKSDASNTYQYYSKEMYSGSNQVPKRPKFFKLCKNLFLAFIQKLTPVRRIAYFIALILFTGGLNTPDNRERLVISFFLINILLAAELADKLTAKDELEIARSIQIDMMPEHPPKDARFDIAFRYESANTVGGDFYDFVESPQKDGFVAIIGDISGKGMEAALHMVQVHALIHSSPYPVDLRNMLLNLNKQIGVLFPSNQFLTGNFFKVNQTDIIEYYRAGHLPVYHYSRKNRSCNAVAPSGLGLGFSNQKQLQKHLEKTEIKFESGDIFCLCTDGLIEAENPAGLEFGEGKLVDILKSMHSSSAEEIIRTILEKLAEFRGNAPRKDDLTILLLRIR